jgi:hypothetical protein
VGSIIGFTGDWHRGAAMQVAPAGDCATVHRPMSVSAELDTYHETFSPGNPATPAMVRA